MLTKTNVYCDSDSLCHDGICGRLDGHEGDHIDPLDGRRWHNDGRQEYGACRAGRPVMAVSGKKPVAISTREEARRLYAQTLREMNPDPEMASRIDRYLRERSTAATERRDPVADLGGD